MKFHRLSKLKQNDTVAILSPSFAAPAVWTEIYLEIKKRLQDYGFQIKEYKTTSLLNASKEERAQDIISAFEDREIKAIFASLGGDDQITYIKDLPLEVFRNNPKPFFGYSDNTHLINHLWLCGVPAYYGCSLFTQLGVPQQVDEYTQKYLEVAFFDSNEKYIEILPSAKICDTTGTVDGLNWDHGNKYLESELIWEENTRFNYDLNSDKDSKGNLWGGCLESIDEMLRHRVQIPELSEWKNIILYIETSEEIPTHDYTQRVLRALGELGYLPMIKGLLVGRPMGSNFDTKPSIDEKRVYREKQFKAIVQITRNYNAVCPIIGNIDFGHTKPQICIPSGKPCLIKIQNLTPQLYFKL